MAFPLYVANIVEKEGATIQVALSLVHPDVSQFGTDRLFAWKILQQWVSPDDDETDAVVLAGRYVRSVALSPLRNGKIDKQGEDFFTVKRGKGPPTVVYTITVTKPAVIADMNVDDSEEMYDYVEEGKGKALPAPPRSTDQAKKATKSGKPARAEPTTLEPKTYDDLRALALAQNKQHGGRLSDDFLQQGMLQRWAKGASDDEVKRWLTSLDAPHQVGGAALVALGRLESNQVASAKDLLRFAEALHKGAGAASDDELLAGGALIPLWWRLGVTAKAAAAFKEQQKAGTGVHTLLSMAALGGKWDEVGKLVPQSLEDAPSFYDPILYGTLAAWRENQPAFDAIMKRWDTVAADGGNQYSELSVPLLRECDERGTPEAYLELMLRYPNVIESDGNMARYALMRTERNDPKLAVALAERLLRDDELSPDLRRQAVGILARHAPTRMKAILKRDLEKWQESGWSAGFLAAAGMTSEARAALAIEKEWDGIGEFATDRDLVIESHARGHKPDMSAGWLCQLADLGERTAAEALLETQLAAIAKLAPKERDLPSRRLADAAGQLGRPDLGFAVIKLPTPALRAYAAGEMAEGAARVGDFTTALAALALVPDKDANDRARWAKSALRYADERFVHGPRAVPLCVHDERYVRGLIAANDRPAIEWLRVAYGATLTASAQAAIDDFFTHGPPAPATSVVATSASKPAAAKPAKPAAAKPAAKPTKAGGDTERYELVEGASSKFWQWTVRGGDLVVEYGRIGTAGQANVKSLGDADKARAAAAKLVKEKLGKGYLRVK